MSIAFSPFTYTSTLAAAGSAALCTMRTFAIFGVVATGNAWNGPPSAVTTYKPNAEPSPFAAGFKKPDAMIVIALPFKPEISAV